MRIEFCEHYEFRFFSSQRKMERERRGRRVGEGGEKTDRRSKLEEERGGGNGAHLRVGKLPE